MKRLNWLLDTPIMHWAGSLTFGPLDALYSLYWSATGGPSVPYWKDWQSRKLPSYPLPLVRDDLPVKPSHCDACGAYLVTMVVTYADLKLLRPLIPRQLEFDPNRIHDGLHPIIYMFGYTQHLHRVWMPISGFGYLEFGVGIPGLRRWKPSQKFQGPFTFVPVLYLQQLYPTFMGWLVGYNKQLRKMSTQEAAYTIRDRYSTQEIIQASFKPSATAEDPPPADHISHWADLTMQPQANRFLEDSLLFLHYHLAWPNAIVQPVDAEVEVKVDVGIPGLKVGKYHWPGIDIGKAVPGRAPEGAFRMWAPFELLGPFTRETLDSWTPPAHLPHTPDQ